MRKNKSANLRKKILRVKMSSISPEQRNIWCQLFDLSTDTYLSICKLNDPTLMPWIDRIKHQILEATGYSDPILYVSYDATEPNFLKAKGKLRQVILQISDLLGNYILTYPNCPRLVKFAAVLFTYTVLQRRLNKVVYSGASSDSDISNISPCTNLDPDFKEEPTPAHVKKNYYGKNFEGEKANEQLDIAVVPAEIAEKAKGWLQIIGPLGEYGYYNEISDEFTYEIPLELEQCLKSIPDKLDSVQHFDEDVKSWVSDVLHAASNWGTGIEGNVIFYKNLETEARTYQQPEELRIFKI